MRTTTFLPALFAVSLLSGAALAEKPQPRGAMDRIRARGDVVDKSYRGDKHVASRAPSRAAAGRVPQINDRVKNRISCSDTSIDCPSATRGAARANGLAASAGAERGARPPAFLQKVLGSDRTSFNEAGEDQGMSVRAAKRAWAKATPDAASAAPGLLAHQPRPRAELQASQNRAACNEGGECAQSSKESKKEWSYQAIKAGTWKGPEAKSPSGAEKAIADWKRQQNIKPEDAKHRN